LEINKMTDPRQIIDYATDGDAVGVREAMYSALYDRVTAAIEAKKQEVGATLVGGMPLATEETQLDADVSDILDEAEKEEGHEDEKEDEKMCKDVAKKEVKGHEKRMHKEDEDIEEGVAKKVGGFLNKAADEIGDAGNAVGSLAGKALGGVAKTVGAIRQTPSAVGQSYNMGRVGAQKAIAK
jgi:hypothetical protein